MSLAGALWFAVQDDLFTNGLCSNSPSPSISISNTTQDKQSSVKEPITGSETHSVLDESDDRFISQTLHFNRRCLRFIVDFIQARLKKDVFAAGHSLISAEASILATLACYAQGPLSSKLTDRLGIDQTAVGEAVKTITKLLADTSPEFITFPNSYNDRMGTAHAFKNLCCIPHVVGVLGYLHVKVSPPLGEEHMYMNTLGYYSVMMQVIFDVDGNLLSLEQCCPGGTPEHTVWENSDIGRQFSVFQHGHTWVVGKLRSEMKLAVH